MDKRNLNRNFMVLKVSWWLYDINALAKRAFTEVVKRLYDDG
jgi:hypothetical protein